jgi:hypothetical protein
MKRLLLKLHVRIDASPNRYFFYFCIGAAVILAIAIYDTFYLGPWSSGSSQLPP